MTEAASLVKARLANWLKPKLDEWDGLIQIHEAEARTLKVTTEASSAAAANIAKEAKLLIDDIEDARLRAVAPVKEITGEIDAKCRERRVKLETIRKHIAETIGSWMKIEADRKREREEAQRKEAEKLRAEATQPTPGIAVTVEDIERRRGLEQQAADLEAQADAERNDAGKMKTRGGLGSATGTRVWKAKVTNIVSLAVAQREGRLPAVRKLSKGQDALVVNEQYLGEVAKLEPLPDVPGVEWLEDIAVGLR